MSKREDKKEQKFREKLQKQGFSKEEIERLVEANRKKTTKKIVVSLVVGVLATTAIVCATVPQVKNAIKDLINKFKGGETDSKEEQKKDEERKQKTHDDDHYQNLDEDEKKDFDDKLKDITDSDYYKNLDDKGKDELLDKFVESEKIQQEVKNDPADKKPEEIESKIADKQNELEQAKQELQDLKNNPDASEEEIAAAEEKQQQAEEQVKSAEQEKAYWETVETVKDSVSINENFSTRNPELKIRRVNGVYKYEGTAYINADFIKEEIIDGKSYFSQLNQFCRINDIVTGEEDYEEILKIISGDVIIQVEKNCINKNSQEQKNYFENNMSNMGKTFEILSENGYNISIVESWNTTDHDKPEFIVDAKSQDDERMYMATYSPELGKYRVQEIQKICPEFWAQLEIERAQTATTSAEAQAQAEIDAFSTFDENGELETFDYPAYQQYLQQMQAEKEAKELEQNMTQETKVTYSEQELGF